MFKVILKNKMFIFIKQNKNATYLFSFVVLGCLLRIYKWMNYSFWYDEVLWLFPDRTFSSLKDFSVFSFKPPLFVIFLFLWKQIATNESFIRVLPLIFGLLTIMLCYKITKILFNSRAGLIAAFILAFSPFHIYYSQELNYYTLTVLFSLVSMYFFIICLQRNEWHLWIKYIIATVACIYTNYICLFLLLSQNLFFILVCTKNRLLVKKWLFSQAIIIISLLPLIHFFLNSISVIKNSEDIVFHWFPQGNWKHIVQTFNVFNLGYNATRTSSFIGFLVFSLLFLWGILTNRKEKSNLFLLLLWLFIPIISSIVVAKTIHINTYTHRNFIYSSVPYYILISNGLTKLNKRHLILVLLILLLLIRSSLINYYRNIFFTPEEVFRQGVHLKIDNRGATKYIIDNLEKNDIIFHTCRNTELPFFYYASFSNKKSIKELVKGYYANKKHFIKNKEEIVDAVKGYKRLWFVFSHWEPEFLNSLNSEERNIKLSLDQTFPLLMNKKFDNIEVYLYNVSK